MSYFIDWGHAYVVHFGVWLTFAFGCTIHGKGLPELKDLPNLFKTAAIISAILAIFSSHSHVHYLNNITHFVK